MIKDESLEAVRERERERELYFSKIIVKIGVKAFIKYAKDRLNI